MTPSPFALNEEITLTPTPDGAVLLNRRTGMYWQLNATAALILDAVCEGGGAQRAAALLIERHPAAADRALDDVLDILRTFQDVGVLITRP